MLFSYSPLTSPCDRQSANPSWSLGRLRVPDMQRQLHRQLCRGIWLVLLCFVLGTLAHSGHVHIPSKSLPTTHEQCDLCVGFGNTMSPPATDTALSVPSAVDAVLVDITPVARSRRLIGLAQARAPPPSC